MLRQIIRCFIGNLAWLTIYLNISWSGIESSWRLLHNVTEGLRSNRTREGYLDRIKSYCRGPVNPYHHSSNFFSTLCFYQLTSFILFSDATCDIPTNNCKFNQIWITCNQQFPCPMGFYCHDNICIDSCKDGRCLRFKDVCTRYIKHF